MLHASGSFISDPLALTAKYSMNNPTAALCQGAECDMRNTCARYTLIPESSKNIIGPPWTAWQFCCVSEFTPKKYPFYIAVIDQSPTL